MSVFRFIPGRPLSALAAPSRCIRSWICAAAFPPSSTLRTAVRTTCSRWTGSLKTTRLGRQSARPVSPAMYQSRWNIEVFFENSTWCTPLDVMEFRGSIALNRQLVGSLDAGVRPRIAPGPLCAESRARSHKPAMPATVSTESTAIQWSV
jgi:hypothetical protein